MSVSIPYRRCIRCSANSVSRKNFRWSITLHHAVAGTLCPWKSSHANSRVLLQLTSPPVAVGRPDNNTIYDGFMRIGTYLPTFSPFPQPFSALQVAHRPNEKPTTTVATNGLATDIPSGLDGETPGQRSDDLLQMDTFWPRRGC
jgi:hypothetical protein